MSLVLTPIMSKDVDQQVKMAGKVIEVVDREIRMICVTLLRYNVEPENSYAKFRIIEREEGGREVSSKCLK